jgi:hypothetical protein
MELGEKVETDGTGCVCGIDTGRVIAKFSHVHEAESFVDMVNGPNVETWINLAEIAFTCGEWSQTYKDAYAKFNKIRNT